MTALAAKAAVAVLGAGTMGRGIARVAAGAGHRVALFDSKDEALRSAEVDINRYLQRDVEKGRLDAVAAAAIYDQIEFTSDLAAVAGSSLVIEAIVEDLAAKVSLLRSVESQVGPNTIIATNTSSLSVTAIAAQLGSPGRVAGMHFFNPAPVMPLVEIVAGADSESDVIDSLAATAAAWGKTPVRAKSTPGFIVNRVARPFYGEALRIVEESVATPAEVDRIITGAGGFRMGPFALMDLVGLDVNLAVSRSVYEQSFHDPRFAPNQIQQQLVDAGRLGRKTGAGFYEYTSDATDEDIVPLPATEPVREIIVHGSGEELAGLVARLEEAGVTTTAGYGPAAGISSGSALLWPSDGRPVSAVDSLAPDLTLVAVDECVDWATASAVAVTGYDEVALSSAAGVLAAAGIAAYRINDGPGLIVLRTMAQLASVAADAVRKGVATATDVDIAMRLGTNYPVGPLEWADAYGPVRIVDFLDNMADYYGEPRYRPSPLLRRAADLGLSLRGDL